MADLSRSGTEPRESAGSKELANSTEVGETLFVKVVPINFDYLIIDTSYTGRLVSHFLDHKYTFNLQGYEHSAARNEKLDKLLAKCLSDREDQKNEDETILPKLDKMYLRKYDSEPGYPEDEEGNLIVPAPLYICDTLWGEGLYLRNSASTEDIKIAMECAREGRMYRGYWSDSKSIDIKRYQRHRCVRSM